MPSMFSLILDATEEFPVLSFVVLAASAVGCLVLAVVS